MALHVFFSYWRSILKIIFLRSSKKILNLFFIFSNFFIFEYFYIFKIFRINLLNDFWRKKFLSAVRLEPVTLGMPALHSASVLPGFYEKMVKWVNIIQFVYFDVDCKLALSKYLLRKKHSMPFLYTNSVSKWSNYLWDFGYILKIEFI